MKQFYIVYHWVGDGPGIAFIRAASAEEAEEVFTDAEGLGPITDHYTQEGNYWSVDEENGVYIDIVDEVPA